MKTALIGGVIGGVLSGVPIVGALNCCFCLLNMGGAAIGISMYLKEHTGENITNGEAAISGTISGAVTGVLAAIIGIIVNLAIGSLMAGLLHNMPREARQLMIQLTAGGVAAFFMTPIYAAFGALGGFLSMQLFFKDRLKS